MDPAVWTLAFRRHVLERIAAADGANGPEELAWVRAACPDEALIAAGLADEFGARLPAFDEARDEALARLPGLPLEDRLALMTSFFGLCLADGALAHAEGKLLVEAARLLGIGGQAFDRVLSARDDVGEVEIDAPLDHD
jgi:uncharacterized tellurite resistance protein B-like protein